MPLPLPCDLQKLREKRKQAARGTVVWQFKPFTNPARSDGLQLSHWVKCYKDSAGGVRQADEGPYHFAKYSKKARCCLCFATRPPVLPL